MTTSHTSDSENKTHVPDSGIGSMIGEEEYTSSSRSGDIVKIASGDGPPLNPQNILSLQRLFGNQATINIVNRQTIDSGHAGANLVTGLKMVTPDPIRNDRNIIQRNGKIEKMMKDRLVQLRAGNVALLSIAGNHIKNFARDTKGKSIVPDAKGIDRVIAKAKAKVASGKMNPVDVGDDIKDILRGTVVYNTFDQLKAGYKKVFKDLTTYGLKVIKVSETYTQEGKEDTARRKNTDVDTTGYGDAKMVFNLDIPDHVYSKHFKPMMFNLPQSIPVELQFQTKAGLAVKSGKLGDQADPEGKWHYRIEPEDPNARWRFNASKFVDDIITKMEDKGIDIKRSDFHLLISLGDTGLPPAHDIYDPVKKAALSNEDVANAEKFYPMIYELAFRYSGMTDNKAQGLNADVKRILKKVKKN